MKSKLIEIFSNILEIDKSEINENLSAEASSDWDSLKQMDLIYAIEEEFDVKFEPQEILELNSYKKICEKVMGS